MHEVIRFGLVWLLTMFAVWVIVMPRTIPEALQSLLDLSDTPTWREILTDFAGTVAALLIPVAFVLCAVAFGWGHP